MAQFTEAEILNELEAIFRGRTTPSRIGGQVDPIEAHAQLLEIARLVFLNNPGAIFYLALLVRNTLNSLVLQEVSIVQDMLDAVEDLTKFNRTSPDIGNSGPTDLSNARTALLALDSAGTIDGRPEFERFDRNLDRFLNRLRPNIVAGEDFRLTAGEARSVLRENFLRLVPLHDRILSLGGNLATLVATYESLSIPSLVGQTAIARVGTSIQSIDAAISGSTDDDNVANSRLYFIRAVASKSAVRLLASFRAPDFSSDLLNQTGEGFGERGIVGAPDTLSAVGLGPFVLRASGEGTAAVLSSSPGPWLLDGLSTAFSLRVDGGATQTVDLSSVQGAVIHGRNNEPFDDSVILPAWPGAGSFLTAPPPAQEDYSASNELHLRVDPRSYNLQSRAWGYLRNTPTPSGTVFPASPTDNAVFYRTDLTTLFVYLPSPGGGASGWFPAETDDLLYLVGRVQFDSVADLNAPPAESGTTAPSDLRVTPRGGPTLTTSYWDTVQCDPPVDLGFKHLGTPVFFQFGTTTSSSRSQAGAPTFKTGTGFSGWYVGGADQLDTPSNWTDVQSRRWDYLLRPRVIAELAPLVEATVGGISGNTLIAGSSVFQSHFVGYYIRVGSTPDTWERYEIIEVLSGTEARVDFRGDTVTATDFVIFGSRGDFTQFTFEPDLLLDTNGVADAEADGGPHSIPDTVQVLISPSVKTASIPSGQGSTAVGASAALTNTSNGSQGSNKYAHASFHARFSEQAGFPGRVTIEQRSRFLPEGFAISRDFLRVESAIPPVGTGSPREINPGPSISELVFNSANQVLGFTIGQPSTLESAVYLLPSELQALLSEGLTGVEVSLSDEEVVSGTLQVIANSSQVQDSSTDFEALGAAFGYRIEILEGSFSGEYLVTAVSSDTLTLALPGGFNSRGFTFQEPDVEYRLFTQKVIITSNNRGPGSTLALTASDPSFGFSSSTVRGTCPGVEAVNTDSQALDLRGLSPGDTIGGRVVEAVSADGQVATVAGGAPANLSSMVWVAVSSQDRAFETLTADLTDVLVAEDLLGRNQFNINLDRLDAALAPLITPGATLQANVSLARSLLTELLASLVDSPDLAPARKNMSDVLTAYSASRVAALDALLDALSDNGLDRARDLLISGDLVSFFAADSETSSFAGQVLASARRVDQDLQPRSQLAYRVDDLVTDADQFVPLESAETDLSDTNAEVPPEEI